MIGIKTIRARVGMMNAEAMGEREVRERRRGGAVKINKSPLRQISLRMYGACALMCE